MRFYQKARDLLLMLFPYGLLFWLLTPILRSAYLADDIPNSQRPAFLSIENESVWEFTLRLTRQWINNEGRFFPVSVFENSLVFTVFDERWMYKSLQVAAVILFAVTFGWLVRLVTNDKHVAAIAVVLLSVTFQVRNWYDPIISFGILLPSTGIKAMLALSLMLLGIRAITVKRRIVYLLTAALLWFLALMQYEVVIALCLVAFLLAIPEIQFGRFRQAMGVMSILVPSLIFLMISRYFRSGVTATPAYQTNFDLLTVIKTLRFQVEGAIPLTVPYSRVDERLAVGRTISAMTLIQIAFFLVVCVFIVSNFLRLKNSTSTTRFILLACGLCLLVLPAIPTSLSVRWQAEVGPGKAYLPVMLQYLGTSLILLFLILEANQLIRRIKHFQLKMFLTATVMVLVSVSMIVVIATNRNGIEHTVMSTEGFRTDREVFESAAKLGIFDVVIPGSVLVSQQANEVMWTNKTYLNWLGGPFISAFLTPNQLAECRANSNELCREGVGGVYDVSQNDKGITRAVVVALSDSKKIAIRVISQNREALPCGIKDAVKKQDWWISDCGTESLSVSQDFQLRYIP